VSPPSSQGFLCRRIATAAFVAFLVAGAAPLHADDREILEVVEKIGQAYRDANVEALERLVTDDYVHTNSTFAAIGRDAWLGWVVSRRQALEAGTLRVVEYENDDLKVVRRGETAIVTGLNRTIAEADGERTVSRVRFTMVFVRVDGVWKRAAFQDCRLAE